MFANPAKPPVTLSTGQLRQYALNIASMAKRQQNEELRSAVTAAWRLGYMQDGQDFVSVIVAACYGGDIYSLPPALRAVAIALRGCKEVK